MLKYLEAISRQIAAIDEFNCATINNFKHANKHYLLLLALNVLDMFYLMIKQINKHLPKHEVCQLFNWISIHLAPKIFNYVKLYQNTLICDNVKCTKYNPNCQTTAPWGILRLHYTECVQRTLELMKKLESIENGIYIDFIQDSFGAFTERLCEFRVDYTIHD